MGVKRPFTLFRVNGEQTVNGIFVFAMALQRCYFGLMKNKGWANIKTWAKGQSGNPKGRAVGSRNRATLLKEILSTRLDLRNAITGEIERLEIEQAVELAIVNRALTGAVDAYKEVKDQVYGKQADKLEVTQLSDADTVLRYIESAITTQQISVAKALEFAQYLMECGDLPNVDLDALALPPHT